jgi:site-specific recombinase XerD
VPSWARHLRAANRSPRTIQSYLEAANQLVAFLSERGMPTDAANIKREHVESYIECLLERWKPKTAAVRYRSLKQLFKWLVDEGEITASPMAKTTPPKVPEVPVPVIAEDDLRRVLSSCKGTAFDDRRDLAMLRLFTDSACGCPNSRTSASMTSSSTTTWRSSWASEAGPALVHSAASPRSS